MVEKIYYVACAHDRGFKSAKKKAKVQGNLLHISSWQGANIIHTNCLTYSCLNRMQNAAFWPCPFADCVKSKKKRKQRQKVFWIEAMDNSDED